MGYADAVAHRTFLRRWSGGDHIRDPVFFTPGANDDHRRCAFHVCVAVATDRSAATYVATKAITGRASFMMRLYEYTVIVECATLGKGLVESKDCPGVQCAGERGTPAKVDG